MLNTPSAQWERRESASIRQLERRRNAMELRRNAENAVTSPSSGKNKFHAISRRSGKNNNAVQLQWQRR